MRLGGVMVVDYRYLNVISQSKYHVTFIIDPPRRLCKKK